MLKSCDLDPIPTSVLKNCLDILVTPITDIIYISMDTSTFPKKEVHVKGNEMNRALGHLCGVLKNCLDILVTPITDIIYISMDISTFPKKILEKVVADWLQAHLKNIHLSNPLQSAYRKHHSTESALLKVHNDIIISIDKCEVTALTLLSTPLTMLHYQIDWQGQIWFSFYCKIGTNPYKLKTVCQISPHSHMEFHGALCWDQCFSYYTLHHSALLSPVLT